MTDNSKNTNLKRCIDIASAVFILYIPYCAIWAHYNPGPLRPLPPQLILLIVDILPSVFGLVWLLYRYLEVLNSRFPFLRTFARSPLYKTIALLIIGLLTILVKAYMPQVTFAAELTKEQSTPHEIQRLHVKGYINAVAWNTDGSRLAALSNFGGTITLWETKNWAVLKEFDRYGGGYSFNSLAFLPDGSLLTAAPIGDYSKDPRYANTPLTDPKYDTLQMFSLIQWNPEAGKPVRYIPDLGYPPKDLSTKVTDTFAASGDGALIATVWADDVKLYETRNASVSQALSVPPAPTHSDYAMSVAFSPNGKELAVGTGFGKVHLFNPLDGSLIHSITAYPTEWYACSALAFSPGGKFIAIGKYSGSDGKLINGVWTKRDANDVAISIWDVSETHILISLVGSTQKREGKDDALVIRTLSWSPNGEILAAGDDLSLRLWRVSAPRPTLLLEKKMSHGTFSTAFSPQGMLAATDNNEVVIYQ